MNMRVAVSGASGKTGYRIAEELILKGAVTKLIVRSTSSIPKTISNCETIRCSIFDDNALDKALENIEALIIATGARPSPDLTGPLKVDALGVQRQIASCKRVGVKRIILVSSLCSGRLIHPLNLFGLILIWKKIGENSLQSSGLDWTIIRPGGLTEKEIDLDFEGIRWSGPNIQESNSIPRRLVAKSCIEALETPESIGRIIEITSSQKIKNKSMSNYLLDN